MVIGSAASLAANVAVAEPSAVGRLIAAWPSCALIGSYELLMRQVRHAATRKTPLALQMPDASFAASEVGPYAPHICLTSEDAASYDTHTAPADPITASYDAQTDSAEELIRGTDEAQSRAAGRADRGRPRPRRPESELQHNAWQWAIANLTDVTGVSPDPVNVRGHRTSVMRLKFVGKIVLVIRGFLRRSWSIRTAGGGCSSR